MPSCAAIPNSLSSWSPLSIIRITFASMRVIRIRPMLRSKSDCPGLPANFAVNPYDADALAFERRQNHRLYPTVTFTPDDWRRYRNAYYRLIEAVDKEIGKILDEVDRQGLWENTVVIFTSDHGDGCGAHQWNQKTALYEEVVNVPFIVCLPAPVHQ